MMVIFILLFVLDFNMAKRMSFVILPVLLLAITTALGIGIYYYSGVLTEEAIKETEKSNIDLTKVGTGTSDVRLVIKNVQIDNVDPGGMHITIENKGRLPVVGVTINVKTPSGEYSKFIDETNSGLLLLNNLDILSITVWFYDIYDDQGAKDISNFQKVKVIPTVKLEDGSTQEFPDEVAEWPD